MFFKQILLKDPGTTMKFHLVLLAILKNKLRKCGQVNPSGYFQILVNEVNHYCIEKGFAACGKRYLFTIYYEK
jgi:hypothetical protein